MKEGLLKAYIVDGLQLIVNAIGIAVDG